MTNPTRADLEQLKQRIEDEVNRWQDLADWLKERGWPYGDDADRAELHRMNLAHVEDHLRALESLDKCSFRDQQINLQHRAQINMLDLHTARLMAHYGGE